MRKRLPCEIRDMVYYELRKDYAGSESVSHWYLHTRITRYHESLNKMVYPRESLENFSHYFNPAFMGTEFATEFLQAIYESAMLSLSHQDEICDYLQNDLIFNTQCVPGLHVNKLEYCLSLGPFDKETGNRDQEVSNP
jgi:hypothetical protein